MKPTSWLVAWFENNVLPAAIGATTPRIDHQAGALNAVSVDGGSSAGGYSMAPAVAADDDVAGPACMMRPGDPGFEECEACQ